MSDAASDGDSDALVDGQRVTTPGDMESHEKAGAESDASVDRADSDASGDSAASATTEDEKDRSSGYA